jgi:hypothetical protein
MGVLAKWLGLVPAMLIAVAPAAAQVRTIDPNSAIDADLRNPPARQAPPPAAPSYPQQQPSYPQQAPQDEAVDPGSDTPTDNGDMAPQGGSTPSAPPSTPAQAQMQRAEATDATYHRDDLIANAEGVFGKGAEGLAGVIEKILKDQGEPNAYIAGREASGAFGIGLRYGSGTLSHKVEGQRPVYWTGPSIGFDVGGDANKVFVLVYNLFDTQELYHRFPAVEGRVYVVGGFAATYLRRGNTVLIPIRLGVGWRLGANVGYLKFTEKSRWLPF